MEHSSLSSSPGPVAGGRVLEPEWLDELPATDPRAIRSRRDLRRVNFWMGNGRILRSTLSPVFRPDRSLEVAELGAGDGSLFLALAKQAGRRRVPSRVTFVDRQPVIASGTIGELERLGWEARVVTADVFAWAGEKGGVDAIFANLFLHHFEDEPLGRLLDNLAGRTSVFVACEPRRTRFSRLGGAMVGLAGGNAVTRHDAAVSIRAGFAGNELSALWGSREGWEVSEREAGLFSHLFVATRVPL